MRLLCMKIASRGDLLLAGPAFAALRRRHPQAHITLLVGRSCLDVAERLPFFDEIRTLDDAALFGASPAGRLRGTLSLLRQMAARFDEVILLHRDWRYALLAWLARVPVRRGFGGNRGERFLTHPYLPEEREHHASQYLGVAVPRDAPSAAPSLEGHWKSDDEEREAALARAAELGFDPSRGPWVALVFGGGSNVKTKTALKAWPVEHFAGLARELDRRGYPVVWIGDQADARKLGAPPVGTSLAGRLSVLESAAVLSACSLVVANDTLMMHMAQALAVPTLALFGPTDPEQYRPLGTRSDQLWLGPAVLPCTPCHRSGFFPPCPHDHRCMSGLSVPAVASAALRLLPPPPPSAMQSAR